MTTSTAQTVSIKNALQLAISQHAAGHLQEAEKLYRLILLTHPQHPDVNHNLGVLALHAGQPKTALPFLQTALDINPSNEQFWISLIEGNIQLYAWDRAEILLSQAVSVGIRHPAITALQERVVVGRNNPSLTSTRQADVASDLKQAEFLLESGQWQLAADNAMAVLNSDPNRVDAWAILALIFPRINKLNDAEQAAQTALSLSPKNSKALRALAVIRLRQQRNDEAAILVEKALRITPECPRALLVLANIRLAQNRFSDADSLLFRAMNIEPLPEIHANLALLEARRNNFDAAIHFAELAIKKKPFLNSICQALANHYQNDGRTELAINALELALQYESSNPVIMSDLGELYRQSGKYKKALAVLECAVKVSPELIKGWVNYGTVLQDINRNQEAIFIYKKALSINPNQVEVLNNIASMYKQDGRFEKAISFHRQVLVLRPASHEAHSNLAASLQALGKPETIKESVFHYQKAFAGRVGLIPPCDPKLSAGVTDFFIELTNKCNFHCDFCPSDALQRDRGVMDFELAKKLYKDVAEKKMASKVNLHLMGEPTLHPQLFELLSFGSNINIKTALVTNGSTLTEKSIGSILDTLYGTLIVSLQTPNKETFKHRGKISLTWERYIDNIRLAVREYVRRLLSEKSSRCGIELRVMVTKNSHLSARIIEKQEDTESILKEWSSYVAKLETEFGMTAFHRADIERTCRGDGGAMSLSGTYPLQQGLTLTFWQGFSFANAMVSKDYQLQVAEENKFCPRPFRDFGVLWNGDVTLCCLDYDGELSVGNINESTIELLLNSDAALKLRAAMLGRHPLPSFCRQCQATASHVASA